jgi:hypothetical protein
MDLHNKYRFGKIYKIVCNVTGKVYIGSTYRKLNDRLDGHYYDYKGYCTQGNNNNYNYVTSFEVLKENDFNIILLEDFPCETKEEILLREKYYIQNTECVNKHIPMRTDDEIRQQNKHHYQKNQKKYEEVRNNELQKYFIQFINETTESYIVKCDNKRALTFPYIYNRYKHWYIEEMEREEKYLPTQKELMKQIIFVYGEPNSKTKKWYSFRFVEEYDENFESDFECN